MREFIEEEIKKWQTLYQLAVTRKRSELDRIMSDDKLSQEEKDKALESLNRQADLAFCEATSSIAAYQVILDRLTNKVKDAEYEEIKEEK